MKPLHPRARWTRLPLALVFGLVLVLTLPSTSGEEATHGWLGVVLGSPEAQLKGSTEELAPRGVPISGVVENGPAAKAGLRAQDRIVAIDAAVVSSARELQTKVRAMEPGSWVQLTVARGDDELILDTHLTEHPTKADGLRIRLGWMGVEAIDLPESLRLHFGAPEDAGVMISNVELAGPADAAGLRVGDVVYEVGGTPIASTDNLRRAVMSGGVGNTMDIVLARYGAEITVEATLAERPPKE